MNQSRLSSLYESLVNIAIGFTINYAANMLILPHIGCAITPSNNFAIGVVYTFISLARQYAIRRWFNKAIHHAADRLARKTT